MPNLPAVASVSSIEKKKKTITSVYCCHNAKPVLSLK